MNVEVFLDVAHQQLSQEAKLIPDVIKEDRNFGEFIDRLLEEHKEAFAHKKVACEWSQLRL